VRERAHNCTQAWVKVTRVSGIYVFAFLVLNKNRDTVISENLNIHIEYYFYTFVKISQIYF
jgi:hypothetical protein